MLWGCYIVAVARGLTDATIGRVPVCPSGKMNRTGPLVAIISKEKCMNSHAPLYLAIAVAYLLMFIDSLR
jgi:hypothetical protein